MNKFLTIIQAISIIQGLFLIFTIIMKRREFVKTTFWLFLGCLISMLLFSLGDDDYNLFLENTSWYFFHEPLTITFFFLLVINLQSEKKSINKNYFLFFIPYFLFVFVESISHIQQFHNNIFVTVLKNTIEPLFIIMLLYSLFYVIKTGKSKWLLVFLVPFTVFYTIDEISQFFIKSSESLFYFDSYGVVLLILILFYFVFYKMIFSPKEILPIVKIKSTRKYSSSKLDTEKATEIKNELIRIMTIEKLFKKQKLNVDEVASFMKVSRPQLSEVLNVHMNVRFQDLLNQYRVDEFINYLEEERYKNYSLFGIANEVGFSSKSSFNATFKKLKGMTPTEYKRKHHS